MQVKQIRTKRQVTESFINFLKLKTKEELFLLLEDYETILEESFKDLIYFQIENS